MEGRSSTDLLGGTEEEVSTVFTIVVDTGAGDEDKSMAEVWKAVRRLKEFKIKNYVVADDHKGHISRRILEYEARRGDEEYVVIMEKRTREMRTVAQYGPPATKVMVKADGRSFADLLKDMKGKVSKEDVGDILSARKGKNGELELRVKPGKSIDEIKNVISDKVQGVVIKDAVRKALPVVFTIKDLDQDASGRCGGSLKNL